MKRVLIQLPAYLLCLLFFIFDADASETLFASSSMGADEWIFITNNGSIADEWWIITENIEIADIIITAKASKNIKWIYFQDSPTAADKWVIITNIGSTADKWVYVEDDALRDRLLGEK